MARRSRLSAGHFPADGRQLRLALGHSTGGGDSPRTVTARLAHRRGVPRNPATFRTRTVRSSATVITSPAFTAWLAQNPRARSRAHARSRQALRPPCACARRGHATATYLCAGGPTTVPVQNRRTRADAHRPLLASSWALSAASLANGELGSGSRSRRSRPSAAFDVWRRSSGPRSGRSPWVALGDGRRAAAGAGRAALVDPADPVARWAARPRRTLALCSGPSPARADHRPHGGDPAVMLASAASAHSAPPSAPQRRTPGAPSAGAGARGGVRLLRAGAAGAAVLMASTGAQQSRDRLRGLASAAALSPPPPAWSECRFHAGGSGSAAASAPASPAGAASGGCSGSVADRFRWSG